MLVLTVKENGSILIGDDVVVTAKVVNGQVRLGIEAPKETPIVRSELLGSN
jgi:carbon storage regulator